MQVNLKDKTWIQRYNLLEADLIAIMHSWEGDWIGTSRWRGEENRASIVSLIRDLDGIQFVWCTFHGKPQCGSLAKWGL